MHIFIIFGGLILWYMAYETKPIIDDEIKDIWKEENMMKRNKLISIIKESF